MAPCAVARSKWRERTRRLLLDGHQSGLEGLNHNALPVCGFVDKTLSECRAPIQHPIPAQRILAEREVRGLEGRRRLSNVPMSRRPRPHHRRCFEMILPSPNRQNRNTRPLCYMGLCHCVSFDITMSPLSRGEWYVAVRPILPKVSAGMRSARQIGQIAGSRNALPQSGAEVGQAGSEGASGSAFLVSTPA
jgi:hypothetical protein